MNRIAHFLKTVWLPLPVWKRLDAAVIVVSLYTALVYAFERAFELKVIPSSQIGSLTTVLNAVLLGVLLGFRNREAYDRWWEGRRLWGQLVNDSRNLALKFKALADVPADDKARIGRSLASFSLALKNHLRGGGVLQDLPGYENDETSPQHVPSYIAGQVFASVQKLRRAGHLTDGDLFILDPHLRAFMDVCGACERIKSTPLPLSYRALLRHGVVFYLLLTPWMVTDELHWVGVPIMALLTYFLMGIELTAEDVEEPFGRDGDDLALATYCETIRKSVAEILGIKIESAPSSRMIDMRKSI